MLENIIAYWKNQVDEVFRRSTISSDIKVKPAASITHGVTNMPGIKLNEKSMRIVNNFLNKQKK